MRAVSNSSLANLRLSLHAGALALAAFSFLACSSDAANPGSSGGSATASGGTGGAKLTGSGGAAGHSGSGGSATGGVTATGGAPASGGNTGTGGTHATSMGGAGRDAGPAGGAGGASPGSDAGGGLSHDGPNRTDSGRTDTRPTATGGAATGGGQGQGGSATGGSTSVGTGADGGLGSSDGKTPITVWMAGDSTMAGDKCSGGGWGDQLAPFLNSNVKVDNRSIGGRSIQTWLYEKNVSSTMGSDKECVLTATTYSDNWNAMLDPTSGMKKGDYLIIEFGINDGDSSCPRHVGATLFQTYLATMAKAAKDRGTQPIFLTSTSSIQCSGATATANRGFRAETKAAGTANDVPVIDMSALSAAAYTKAGLCPNSDDYTSTTSKVGVFFCNDHTHFAEPGAIEIARVATVAFVDQGIGLASYLK